MRAFTIGDLLNKADNNFNLIRLISAFLVIYGHTFAITGNPPQDIFLQYIGFKFIGGVAVDIFFVTSGFFITSSAFNSSSLIHYIGSRVLRIYPALIVCIVLTVFLFGPIMTVSNSYWSNSETWKYLWINMTATNVVYFLPGVFQNLHDKAVNGSLWSISVEVELYIAIFILAFTKIINNKVLFNLFFFLIFFLAYILPSLFIEIFKYENYVHVAMMFFIGSFIYINKDDIIISAPILLLLLFFLASQHNTPSFGIAYNIVLPYIIFCFASLPGLSFFNKMGDYSYGVYLYGWPSQQIVYLNFHNLPNYMQTIFSISLALFLALFSWHLIEKKALNLKRQLPKKKLNLFFRSPNDH